MPELHLPREYYLRRAVACYDAAGEPRAAAAVLAAYGTPTASAEAARRFDALGDLTAAGEAYLAAQQPHAALACFRRAGLSERVLACLQVLDDDAQLGALLLDLRRPQEAHAPLERALDAATEPARQATLRLHLARALADADTASAQAHYRTALDLLAQLPATPASAEAWAALGAWGQACDRQDRMQEGFAQALRLLERLGDTATWQAVAARYRDAAQQSGNRRLAAQLDVQLAARAAPPPDPARALLDAGRWDEALAQLEPRARAEDGAAKALLAELVEHRAAPQDARLRAGELLGALGDPRPGVATLAPAWCEPFPAGVYPIGTQPDPFNRRSHTPQAVRLETFRIARYAVTNAAYAPFIAAGGYQQHQWWTVQGWRWRESTRRTQPIRWADEHYNAPNQPVVGVSWYEASAYCAWLTAHGRAAGWLGATEQVRLPSEAEWEVAAFWDHAAGQPRPWQPPEGELWQNVREAGIGRPTPVGMFPRGATPCGALDMAGNVFEWCASRYASYPQDSALLVEDVEEFGLNVVLRGGVYYLQNEHSSCGARYRYNPGGRIINRGFRIVWSLAAHR